MFPQAIRSLHLLPFPASSPTGVGAFVEPKIIIRRHMDFWTKEDKNTLEVQWDSYARAAGNHPSTKSKVPKIGNNSKPISSNPFYKVTPKTYFIPYIFYPIFPFLANQLANYFIN